MPANRRRLAQITTEDATGKSADQIEAPSTPPRHETLRTVRRTTRADVAISREGKASTTACKRYPSREPQSPEPQSQPPTGPAMLGGAVPGCKVKKGRPKHREVLNLRDHNRPACPFRSLQREYLCTGPSVWVAGQLGVFAAQDIPKGTRLGRYAGRELTLEQAAGRRWDRVLYVGGRHVDGTNILSLINSPRGTGRPASCRFLVNGMVVTRRAIKKGDELLVGYGGQYWNYKKRKHTEDDQDEQQQQQEEEEEEEEEAKGKEKAKDNGRKRRRQEGEGDEEQVGKDSWRP